MENPIAPPERKLIQAKPYNPLDTDDAPRYGRYDFYR